MVWAGLEPEEFTTTQARSKRSYQMSQELAQTTSNFISANSITKGEEKITDMAIMYK